MKNNFSNVLVLLILLLVSATALVGVFFYSNADKNLTKGETSAEESPLVRTTLDTSDWPVHTHESQVFSISYPPEFDYIEHDQFFCKQNTNWEERINAYNESDSGGCMRYIVLANVAQRPAEYFIGPLTNTEHKEDTVSELTLGQNTFYKVVLTTEGSDTLWYRYFIMSKYVVPVVFEFGITELDDESSVEIFETMLTTFSFEE